MRYDCYAALTTNAGKVSRGMGNQMILTVTTEDRRAFFEITGRSRTEIFPRRDRDFFVEGGSAEATFVRNADGKVVKAILK